MARHCYYAVLEHDAESRYRCAFNRELNPHKKLDSECIAELCAEDYLENHDDDWQHDCWQADWPLTFALYQEGDTDELCRVKVGIDQTQAFRGRTVKEKD